MTTTPTPEDFDGCARACRRTQHHTRVWGSCAYGVAPEPTVTISKVFTASDGRRSIGFDAYTVQQLADLMEPALRAQKARASNSADLARAAAEAILHRGCTAEGEQR